jgi:hypothetical protein
MDTIRKGLARAAASEFTTTGDASKVAQLDSFRLDCELVAIVLDHVNLVMAETPPLARRILSVCKGYSAY